VGAGNTVELSEDRRRKGWFEPSNSCHAVLEDIGTADETWVYHKAPKLKRAGVGWEGFGPRDRRISRLSNCHRVLRL
jgi:hypothetical protein